MRGRYRRENKSCGSPLVGATQPQADRCVRREDTPSREEMPETAVGLLESHPGPCLKEHNTRQMAVALCFQIPEESGDHALYAHKQRFHWGRHALPRLLRQ